VLKSPADLAFPDNFIASSAVLLRASSVRAVGGYRPDLRYAEDLELWLRMLERGTGIVTPIVVSRYHSHPHQATSIQGEAHAGHARVLAMSIDRPWWDPSLPLRWSAVPHWDALRLAYAERRRAAVIQQALKLVRQPQRLLGLAAVWSYRLQRRRRSARMTAEGIPTVAVLPGAHVVPRPSDVDMRSQRLPAALLSIALRPPERAIVGRRWHVPLVSLLRIRAVFNPPAVTVDRAPAVR
jgi:proteasome lid subunit RPN8/RPN11